MRADLVVLASPAPALLVTLLALVRAPLLERAPVLGHGGRLDQLVGLVCRHAQIVQGPANRTLLLLGPLLALLLLG